MTGQLGALTQWQREVHARRDGQHPDRPSTWRDGPLYRAACFEAAALDARAAGLEKTAEMLFERAAGEIVDAVAARVA